MVESVSIGIPKLDRILLNGVPRGYTILVKGTPGSGQELFAKQFASVGSIAESVVYITSNERAEEVRAIMQSYHWPTNLEIIDIATEYYEKVLLREQEISRIRRDGFGVADLLRLNEDAEDRHRETEANFLNELNFEVTNMKPPFRVVIDSLDFFLEHYPNEDVLSCIRTIKAHTHHNLSVTLLTMNAKSYSPQIENSVDAIVDCVIELDVQQMASEFETRMIVRKMRNYPNKTAILTYSITEKGITPEMVSRIT